MDLLAAAGLGGVDLHDPESGPAAEVIIPTSGGAGTRIHVSGHHSRYLVDLLQSMAPRDHEDAQSSSTSTSSDGSAPKRSRTIVEGIEVVLDPAECGVPPDGPRSIMVPPQRWKVLQHPPARNDSEPPQADPPGVPGLRYDAWSSRKAVLLGKLTLGIKEFLLHDLLIAMANSDFIHPEDSDNPAFSRMIRVKKDRDVGDKRLCGPGADGDGRCHVQRMVRLEYGAHAEHRS